MASDHRPLTQKNAPDPAKTYERAKPENESESGTLGVEDVVPDDQPDRSEDAVANHRKSQDVKSAGDADQRAKIDETRKA